MPFNGGYTLSKSEQDIEAVSEFIIDCKPLSGTYRSLGETSPLELTGFGAKSSAGSSGSLLSTISDKVSGSDSDTRSSLDTRPGNEGRLITLIQIIGPFLVAGIGSMCTGILLNVITNWDNFITINALIMLVPTLLGLKGNLEMTVTARLCTAANLGRLDDPKVLLTFLRDDLLLTQFQATIVALLASTLTLGIQALSEPSSLTWENTIIVISSSVVSASCACFFLGVLMTGVVAISRKYRINPDNVAAPLASSLGDISTLALFAYISLGMYALRRTPHISIMLTLVFIVLCPLWGYLACQNSDVRAHLKQGWLPILIAMSISLGAGYILDTAARDLAAAPAFVPVVSGVCGNLLVILICRMTTILRLKSTLGHDNGTVPAMRAEHPLYCGRKKFGNLNATFQLLLVLPIVVHSAFVPIISMFTEGAKVTAMYLFVFLALVFVHALIMLFLTRETVLQMWTYGIDPDVASIPILTAVADLTGGAFTCAIFVILNRLHDPSVAGLHQPGVEVTTPYGLTSVLNASAISY